MIADRVNRWLTLGANIGVLIGIILLLQELNQNATLMEAQIWNERSNQGIAIFMSMATSAELSDIDVLLQEAGFPDDLTAMPELTPRQKRQYYWYLRAERFRIENLLAQQLLGLRAEDRGPAGAARELFPLLEAFEAKSFHGRLEALVDEVENLRE